MFGNVVLVVAVVVGAFVLVLVARHYRDRFAGSEEKRREEWVSEEDTVESLEQMKSLGKITEEEYMRARMELKELQEKK